MAASKLRRVFSFPLIVLVHIYRKLVSPLIGRNCRFQPTCSAYALECLEAFSLPKACWLIVHRLLRCHPFSEGGIDLPPIKDADDKQNADLG